MSKKDIVNIIEGSYWYEHAEWFEREKRTITLTSAVNSYVQKEMRKILEGLKFPEYTLKTSETFNLRIDQAIKELEG